MTKLADGYVNRSGEMNAFLLTPFKALVQQSFGIFGYKIVRKVRQDLVYIHSYKGGADEYRREQIFHNKRKINHVWADETTLYTIKEYIACRINNSETSGICHGARNGFEVEWFRAKLGADAIGTDISETAANFPNMVIWDFHNENVDWECRFDFVYTNSLDQAMDPERALNAWAKQIKTSGFIFIEHTMQHSAAGASAMDPFGAHPMCMPYLFFVWGRGKYVLCDILKVKEKRNNKMEAWIFVLRKFCNNSM